MAAMLLVLVMAIGPSPPAAADGYAAAREAHLADGRPLVVLVTAPSSCHACRVLEQRGDVQRLRVVAPHFAVVDVQRQPRLARLLLKGSGIPAVVIFLRDGGLRSEKRVGTTAIGRWIEANRQADSGK